MKTHLLVKCDDYYLSVSADAPTLAALGHRWGFVTLSGSDTPGLVAQAQAVLDQMLGRPQSIAVELAPGVPDGFLDWQVGDTVDTVDDAGDPISPRVLSIQVDESDDGRIRYRPELDRIRIDPVVRLSRAVRRMADGSATGRIESAQPATIEQAPALATIRSELPPFSPTADTVAAGISQPWKLRAPTRITQMVAQLREAGSSSTSLALWVNGVPVLSWSISAGAVVGYSAPGDYLDVDAGSDVQVEIQAAGSGAAGLVVRPFTISP